MSSYRKMGSPIIFSFDRHPSILVNPTPARFTSNESSNAFISANVRDMTLQERNRFARLTRIDILYKDGKKE